MNHFHVLFCLTINIIHYIYYVYVSSKATKIFYLSRLRNFKLAYMVYHSKIFNTISLLQHFCKTTIYLKHFLRFFFCKTIRTIFFFFIACMLFFIFCSPSMAYTISSLILDIGSRSLSYSFPSKP
jgi:hypothetical protein